MGGGIIRNWLAKYRPGGAAVPFEAPALRMARVCDNERDGLIAILRDFANNGTAYIVPWASLPLMGAMSAHDMALHQAVAETRASTPAQVRAVVSRLALSGALGPEAKSREHEQARSDRLRIADVELVLILHLLHSCGADLAALLRDPGGWNDAEAKAALTAAAGVLGLRRQDIHQRIAEFTQLLSPVGLVTSDGPIRSGWLRVLYAEIEAFAQVVALPAPPDDTNAQQQLAVIATAAARTTQLAGTVLGVVDYAVLDIGGTLRRWRTELPVLRQAIDRLSQMLDEWPPLMKSVHDVLRGPRDQLAGQLRMLHAMVPQIPDIATARPASAGAAPPPSVTQVLGDRLAPIWSLLRSSRGA